MTAHLLMVTIGPVQDFIAAARRTRDLWYGSHLLSELSRCVAREIDKNGGKLIFPAFESEGLRRDPELEACLGPTRPGSQQPVSVANIILARVTRDGDAVEALAKTVRETLQEFWVEIAGRVKVRCVDLIAPDVDKAWDEQIRTFLEFSAAWTPIERPEDYARGRERLAKAVTARKNLRDFEPWTEQRSSRLGIGVAKSSLDGARETVLREVRPAKPARRYRIGPGEQLDAVGLVKRAGGETAASCAKGVEENELQFVPIVNIALGPWLKMAKATRRDEFQKLEPEVRRIELAFVTRKLPCVEDFPFDASIFLENRLWPTFEEQGRLEDPNLTVWRKRVGEWGEEYVDPILASPMNKPYPYVACLVADGDKMGAAISEIAKGETPDKAHFDFSKQLAEFPKAARGIVERHMGSLVYSGADDVLAFLPLAEALACANKLRENFAAIMAGPYAAFEEDKRPTLSVGLGIGHVLEGMGDLLNLGRAAEKLAKGGDLVAEGERRNALAIMVDKRSGGTLSWRAQWTEKPTELLQKDVEMLRDELSVGKVFRIAETLQGLPKKSEPVTDDALWADILASECVRSLKRTEGGKGAMDADAVGLNLKGAGYEDRRRAVGSWIARLMIAKTFAQAAVQPLRVREPA